MPLAQVYDRAVYRVAIPAIVSAVLATGCTRPERQPIANRYKPDPTITVVVVAEPGLRSRIETIIQYWFADHGYVDQLSLLHLEPQLYKKLEQPSHGDEWEIFDAPRRLGIANLFFVRVAFYEPTGRTQIGITWNSVSYPVRSTSFTYCSRCSDQWIRKHVDWELGNILLGRNRAADDNITEPE